MCAISGSFDTETLKSLVELNLYRGQHSWSLAYYNVSKQLLTATRGRGEIDLDIIDIPEGCYGICHTQAPTTEKKDDSAIHPALYIDDDKIHALWHNGIIKDRDVKRLQQALQMTCETWDTRLLLKHIVIHNTPDNIDGTFSCLWARSFEEGRAELILFRNEISPMFYNDNWDISSTKFEDSSPTPPNKMLKMDFNNHELKVIGEFKTVENPYFFNN